MDLFFKGLLLFSVTYVLLKLFIPNAHKFGLLDVPNERSIHTIPVARGAGIIFGLVFFITILIYFCMCLENFLYLNTFLALVVVYMVGIYDDIFNLSSKKKFVFLLVAASVAYFDGFAINSLGNYFGYELNLGYFSLPFTLLAVVGFTNAVNLTDGLDGLAGSISIVILTGLLCIGYIHSDLLLIYLPIIIIIPLSSFLIFNWSPANVFMGDSGSLFLGFIIAILSIYALQYINPASVLFLAAIPLLDTLIVMRRRSQRHLPLFKADKNHMHHLLFNFKQDNAFTVRSFVTVQIIFTLIFLQVYAKSDFINIMLFGFLFITFFSLFDPRALYRKHE